METLKRHQVFFETIQCELIEYKYVLVFEAEHPFTDKLLRVDVVIIKKKAGVMYE